MGVINRTQYFYSDVLAPTASFKDTTFELRFQPHEVKIIVEGANANVSFKGPDDAADDGLLKPAAGENPHIFTGIKMNRIAVKGAGSTVRIWAY